MINWDQLRTMLWLRWRLTRNQWRRGGELNAVITLIAVFIALSVGLAAGVGGLLGGRLGLSEASPLVLMLVWDGLVAIFLLMWTVGLVAELQRAEIIDPSRLLHLPVSPRDVFLLNYLSSHLRLALAMLGPAMLGLAAGLVLNRGLVMVWLFPLIFGFLFLITAWTYCLQGWLASLMVNQRRRRAIVMGITLAFVLLAQVPNLVTNLWFRRHPARNSNPDQASVQAWQADQRAQKAKLEATLALAHQYVPLLWLPQGARSLAEGRVWPALGGAAGLIALGALGLRRAYRSTLLFYQGGSAKPTASKPLAPKPLRPGAKILVERRLPWIPEAAAALALATFRSLTRAPEVKMALAVNVFVLVVFGAGALLRGGGTVPEVGRPFIAVGAVLVTFLGLTQVLFNQFGFDRDGFRALVLLPAPRRQMLLGKNLASLPLALLVFLVFLVLLTVLIGLPASAVLSACLLFATAFLSLSALGNLTSVLVPFRIAAGSLKPTKLRATSMLLIMATQLLFPLAMLPLLVPPTLGALCQHFGGLPAVPITLAASALLLGLSVALYAITLEPLGRLLQRREQRILQIVTQEVE